MVKDNKGNEKHHPMHENRALRQKFLHYSKFSTSRVQPTRPRAAQSAGKCPVQVTRHGAVLTEHAPVPSLLFAFGTGSLDTGPCSANTTPCSATQ
ncbi:hypothetical protein Hanom_Chr13g01215191 [Helianthus anomalus]